MAKFEKRDTIQLQYNSLLAFMASLGYQFVEGGWVTVTPSMQHIRRLSHRTAIALHNLSVNEWIEVSPGVLSPVLYGTIFDIAMNGYTLARVQSSKMVQKVKMQPNRKAVDGVEVQNQMVKPMQPYMINTFGLVA